MAPAKLLSAFVALAVIVVAGAQTSTPEHCPPCNKIFQPVCGVDENDEIKTFPNSCIMRWCNCELRNADADRSFTQINKGNCEEDPSNETDIPECFPEMETTTEPADDDTTSEIETVSKAKPTARPTVVPRTHNVSEATPTARPTVVPRTQNATGATPTAGTGLEPRTQNATKATPAAGARLVPGPSVALVAAFATLLAMAADHL